MEMVCGMNHNKDKDYDLTGSFYLVTGCSNTDDRPLRRTLVHL